MATATTTTTTTTTTITDEKTAGHERTDDEDRSSSRDSSSSSIKGPTLEPIRPASRISRKSHASQNRLSLHRVRSNNGYGVDDLVDRSSEEDGVAGGGGGGGGGGDIEAVSSQVDAPDALTDPYEVTWDGGDNDPMCPRSMPQWRKWLVIFITSVGSFCVTNGSAVYTASYADMMSEFNSSRIVVTLGLSFYVLGIALGPFWSPLAEFYGRRPIYLASFLFFMIFLIPSALAKNIQTMIVSRFFQGLAGSAFLSVSGGTVSDMFTHDKMLMPMAIFSLSPFVGPSTGPLIGGVMVMFVQWRWMHYYLLILSGALFLSIALLVPETYHPVLLKRKAARIRKETGDERYYAPIERSTKSIPKTVGLSLLRPFQILMFEPMALILNIYTAMLLGLLYLFFGAFPLIFTTNHDFNLWQVGLTFTGLLVAMIIACCVTPLWNNFRYTLKERRRRRTGVLKDEPEDQLPQVIVGAPLITGGLFWFGFTSTPEIHWIVPLIGSGVFGLGMSFAFTGVFTFLVAAYPRYAASALASNALVRCSFAAAFPLFGYQMYEALGFQWATGLLAFITLGLMPFPYIFFRYGRRIRERSRFASAT